MDETSTKGIKDEKQFSLEFQNGMPVSKGVVKETTDGTIYLENVSSFYYTLSTA